MCIRTGGSLLIGRALITRQDGLVREEATGFYSGVVAGRGLVGMIWLVF